MLTIDEWSCTWFDEGLQGLAKHRELAKREYVPNLASELLRLREALEKFLDMTEAPFGHHNRDFAKGWDLGAQHVASICFKIAQSALSGENKTS